MPDRHEAALRAALAERDRMYRQRVGDPVSQMPIATDHVVTRIVEAALAAADAHPCGTKCNPPLHVGHGLGVDTDDPRVHLTGEPDQ